MRARHRHFNARHAGADLVLDSRYIDQSDNTAVSAWPDRSANNHTVSQSTAASQPTFRTNQLNGNPVVRFDGSADFLNGGDILDVLDRGVTMICVAKISSGASAALCGKSRAASASGRFSLAKDSGTFLSIFSDSEARNATVSDSSTTFRINTMAVNRANTNTLFFDGAQKAQNANLIGTTSYNTADQFFIGAYQSSSGTTPAQLFLNGDISQVVVIFTFNTPLRRRMEHAAAYSFKISCN